MITMIQISCRGNKIQLSYNIEHSTDETGDEDDVHYDDNTILSSSILSSAYWYGATAG
jgi:hypothetical protein